MVVLNVPVRSVGTSTAFFRSFENKEAIPHIQMQSVLVFVVQEYMLASLDPYSMFDQPQ